MNSLKKEEFKKFNVLVIGDSGTDVFIYGSAVRLAPEAPVPVLNPLYEEKNSGMAGNVVANLQSLGINTFFVHNPEEITKTRYVDERSGQILLRVDRNDKVSKIENQKLLSLKNNTFDNKKMDAIIISDYNKGFLSEKDIKFICENNENVFIDTKKILNDWCVNADFIKINHVEYEHTFYSLKNLNLNKLFPVKKVDIRDVSGAGDTFLSALVAEYVLSKDIEKSIIFAQECATIVVQKHGVSTI
jgi:D-beta-D-heptose 7-phosphate kinase/D-beta-D-heptose 1-phosphate adenosyltransferase